MPGIPVALLPRMWERWVVNRTLIVDAEQSPHDRIPMVARPYAGGKQMPAIYAEINFEPRCLKEVGYRKVVRI